MALQAGTRLGPYEVLSLIGAGGMGEVYRARDPRLGRFVAIKVLRASVLGDAERIRRFEMEARAVGALNHPNIVAVHDVGCDHGENFIVTELLEGETLRRRLSSGALPLKRALDLAAQVVRGLAAAHAAGIVHRDLKPENLLITRDGRIKILDFGLAHARPAEDLSDISTELPLTQSGVIMGTIGYMAPEQVRGQRVDFRADVFAFGCILYEMLGGSRAFVAGTSVEIMSAILNSDPKPLSRMDARISVSLDRVVKRCLEKDPSARYQATDDLAFDLELMADGEAGAAASREQPRLIRASVVTVGFVVLAFAAVVLVATIRNDYTPPAFHRLTFRRGILSEARFAYDSRTVVYSAAWDGGPMQLYTTRTEHPESRTLEIGPAALLDVSQAGTMAFAARPVIRPPLIAYSGTLAQAPLAGGGSRELVPDVSGADWSPDGSRLAIITKGWSLITGGRELQFPVGRRRYLSRGWISDVRVSPNGDQVAFVDHADKLQDDRGSLVVLDTTTDKTQSLVNDWVSIGGLAWPAAGDEIWFSGSRARKARDLWAVSRAGRLRLVISVPGGLTLHDVADDYGALISLDRHRDGILGIGPGDSQERDLSWLDWSSSGDLSADGKMLLFTEHSETVGSYYAACLRASDGGAVVTLGEGDATALSPDRKWAVAMAVRPKPHLALYPTGPGTPKTLAPGPVTSYIWASWFPDGRRLIFAGAEAGSEPRTWVQTVSDGPPRAVTEPGVIGYGVTADGRFVVASGFLVPLQGGQKQRIPGWTLGDIPAENNRSCPEMYVWRYELPTPVYRLDLTTGVRTHWKNLMPTDAAGLAAIGPVTVSADGRAYVYTYTRFLSELYVVVGLK
jgi:eukaryotic-like serine/threonine-protein kinase